MITLNFGSTIVTAENADCLNDAANNKLMRYAQDAIWFSEDKQDEAIGFLNDTQLTRMLRGICRVKGKHFVEAELETLED